MGRVGVVFCLCERLGDSVGKKAEGILETVENELDFNWLATHPGVCTEMGVDFLRKAVQEQKLEGLVVACVAPRSVGPTLKKAIARETNGTVIPRCIALPVGNPEPSTQSETVEALKRSLDELREKKSSQRAGPLIERAMVIGGGIAGMTAAIDLGNGGYETILVDRLPSIGGRMLQLSETFPTLDCAQCTLTPKTVETGQHPKIRLRTYCEVEKVEGQAGHFTVTLRRKAAYVDWEKCTGCGLCQEKCPKKTPSAFDRGVGLGKAIYTLSPQAVPNKPVIDPETCRYLQEGKCQVCEKVCPVDAIDYEQKETFIQEEVGAIVVATGFDLYPLSQIGEYGSGSIPDVVDGLAFERLLSASGPTTGEIRRPSDGRIPKELVFIQCTASRDPDRYMPYCSRVCCMYTAKHAKLYKHKVPDGRAYVFYMDIRSTGKGYEEFIQQGMEEEGTCYLRGRVSRLFQDGKQIMVWGVDTLTGKRVEIAADMVVLATAIIPSEGAGILAQKLPGVETDVHGFFTEAHWKLYPVDSGAEGVYFAGCDQGAKDIADTVAQGSAAASKVQALFAQYRNEAIPEAQG
ncbi:MAG: FAD-dependent oxidoreductase [Proteobacteria bacterium]|nr:FAD-dependent oxidoreductase [Pseudomonadota bacterium]